MGMDSYLVEGEEILAQAGSFYASNKRLIKYKKHLNGDELDDIPYSYITSVGVVRKTRRGFIRSGISIAIVGFSTLTIGITIMPTLKSITDLWGNPLASQAIPAISGVPFPGLDLASFLKPLIPFGIATIALGVLLILLGVFLPQVFIQFRAPTLTTDTEAKFRLGGIGKETSLNLVRIVRQQSMAKKSESVNVQSPENRENQT